MATLKTPLYLLCLTLSFYEGFLLSSQYKFAHPIPHGQAAWSRVKHRLVIPSSMDTSSKDLWQLCDKWGGLCTSRRDFLFYCAILAAVLQLLGPAPQGELAHREI